MELAYMRLSKSRALGHMGSTPILATMKGDDDGKTRVEGSQA